MEDDYYDAVRIAIKALGGAAALGARMYPTKSLKTAEQSVLDCANRNRVQEFKPLDLLAIHRWARAAGCHALNDFFNDDGGYERTKPKVYAEQIYAAEQRLLKVKSEAEEAVAVIQNLIQAKTLAEQPRVLEAMRHANIKVEDL